MTRCFIFILGLGGSALHADCDFSISALNRYEVDLLQAADKKDVKKMAEPLACMIKMHAQNDGLARYMAHSYLRPLLGGAVTKGVKLDPRYSTIQKAIEELSLRSTDHLRGSFVAEFSKGDWRFYTLFCEQGNTEYCTTFLPDEERIKSESPLLAAASMLRLRQAYQVLKGDSRELVAQRLKNLYRAIPESSRLQRKFIEQIYHELFVSPGPISLV